MIRIRPTTARFSARQTIVAISARRSEKVIHIKLYMLDGNRSGTAESVGQVGAGAMNPGFDGADGPADREGDFFVGQMVFVIENEDGAIFGSNASERSFEFRGEVVGIVERSSRVGAIVEAFDDDRPSGTARERRPAAIGGDSQKPGTQRPIAIEAGKRPQCANERFLRHVLGVLPMTQHSQTQAENDPFVPLDEEPSRLGISLPDSLDQRSIIHQTSGLPFGSFLRSDRLGFGSPIRRSPRTVPPRSSRRGSREDAQIKDTPRAAPMFQEFSQKGDRRRSRGERFGVRFHFDEEAKGEREPTAARIRVERRAEGRATVGKSRPIAFGRNRFSLAIRPMPIR